MIHNGPQRSKWLNDSQEKCLTDLADGARIFQCGLFFLLAFWDLNCQTDAPVNHHLIGITGMMGTLHAEMRILN